MATYGPRPSDTLDFARVKRPQEPKPGPWAIEDDGPRSYRALAPPSRILLGMELFLVIFTVVSVVAYLLGWVRI